MKERIQNYMKYTDSLLQEASDETDWEIVKEEFMTQLAFYQHERLVHLIVTMTFAIMTVMTIGIAITGQCVVMFLGTFAFLVLLVPYVLHYMFLENAVQYMYRQYDEICKNINSTD